MKELNKARVRKGAEARPAVRGKLYAAGSVVDGRVQLNLMRNIHNASKAAQRSTLTPVPRKQPVSFSDGL